MGKRLSDEQSAFLDTLLGKYADQIANFETIKVELIGRTSGGGRSNHGSGIRADEADREMGSRPARET